MREPEEEIRFRMEKAVKTHGLEKLMNRSIFKLSGGEKQKNCLRRSFRDGAGGLWAG